MNKIAEQLIHDLRFDANTREHFSITSWWGKGSCGSIGCIAGTAIVRAFGVKFHGIHLPETPEMNAAWKSWDGKDIGYFTKIGASALGIKDFGVASQLFQPTSNWCEPLRFSRAKAEFITRLSHNERPDLSSIEKMILWAANIPEKPFHPTACANALENVLKHERLYVDWAEAHEEMAYVE